MLDATARSVGQIGGAGMVMIDASGGLDLRTADGTTEASAYTDSASISRDGRVMVDHRLLSQAVKSLPDAPVILTYDDRSLHVRADGKGGARFSLNVADTADFPPSMQDRIGDGATLARFAGADFAATVARVAYAVSRDESRYGLNGIHIEATSDDDGDLCRLVATDGSRLAWAEMEVEQGAIVRPAKRLVPGAFLGAVAAVCRDAATVALSMSQHGLSATVEASGYTVTLCSRWMDGEFPDYRQIIGGIRTSSTVTMRRGDLAASIRRVGIMATGLHRLVTVTTSADEVRLSAAGDMGDSSEVVAATVEGAPDWRSGVNAAFLADALGQSVGEMVRLDLGGALDPICIPGPRMLALIMPMRID
ncbi:MAG: DNA polymerase III subunit beta [Candidatus Limnocylindrus sp.]